jgi:hypothetical protein
MRVRKNIILSQSIGWTSKFPNKRWVVEYRSVASLGQILSYSRM